MKGKLKCYLRGNVQPTSNAVFEKSPAFLLKDTQNDRSLVEAKKSSFLRRNSFLQESKKMERTPKYWILFRSSRKKKSQSIVIIIDSERRIFGMILDIHSFPYLSFTEIG